MEKGYVFCGHETKETNSWLKIGRCLTGQTVDALLNQLPAK